MKFGYNLSDIYGTHNDEKARACDYCAYPCRQEKCKNFHITSHNTFGFSVALATENGVRIETSISSYLI